MISIHALMLTYPMILLGMLSMLMVVFKNPLLKNELGLNP